MIKRFFMMGGLFLAWTSSGCALLNLSGEISPAEKPHFRVVAAKASAVGPPLGLAEPKIPAELAARARLTVKSAASLDEEGGVYTYTLDCQCPGDPLLVEKFSQVSRLALMRESVVSRVTLEQRLAVSLIEGESLLRSQGCYDGQVTGRLEEIGPRKIKAIVIFIPGSRYRVGSTLVRITSVGTLPKDSDPPPRFLAEVGLEVGAPAVADDILAAVSRLESAWRNKGYPQARIESSRFVTDRLRKELEVEINLNPGPFVRMGPIWVDQTASVDQSYLDALKTWREGQPWNQVLLETYLEALRRTGLFQFVENDSSLAEVEDGLRTVRLKLAKVAERTVGGQVSFDTDFGLGLSGYWEHRNLTGHGDQLRLELPVWLDLQELIATYRYPFLFRPDQDFITAGGLIHQDTDAYKLWSWSFRGGLERRLSRWWRVSLMGLVEGGSLEDPDKPSTDFFMFGLPLAATYDSTKKFFDPASGARLILTAAPYTGYFHSDFKVMRTRLEAQSFVPLSSEHLVLALRGVWGGAWGAKDSQEIPSSLRFYSGGGGSVRGYDYKSVGPRNTKNDPLGGVAQVETGAEIRARFTETFGAVAFLDGGMVYKNVSGALFKDLLWGAGLGFRYYTPVGPARLDLAFPLDLRPGDAPWQLYLSLGQSF